MNLVINYRKRAGLTQIELARLTQTTQKTISNIEIDKSEPRVSLALKIAKNLNTTVEKLFPLDYN